MHLSYPLHYLQTMILDDEWTNQCPDDLAAKRCNPNVVSHHLRMMINEWTLRAFNRPFIETDTSESARAVRKHQSYNETAKLLKRAPR